MRKSNLALLVAVLVASPLALASSYPQQPQSPSYGGGYGGGYDDNDSSIVDSFNDDITKEATFTYEKDKTITDSFNQDNDKLKMKDINNDKSFKYTDNSDNSKKFYFKSNHEHTETWKINIEENHYMAKSELKGEVMKNDVTYGGACCRDHGGYGNDYNHNSGGGYGNAGSLTVTHVNDMSGAFAGASGINLAGQNAGNNSLIQQSASTNAVLLGQ